jgi:Tol biopolymer transport system component
VRPGTLPPVTDVLVLDDHLAVRHEEAVPGTPSRARVSPDGKRVDWTVFVTGDSYAATGFSTRAGVYEIDTGRLVKTIEELPVFVDGQRYFAADVNYWGITFAPDGNRFYATLGSKGQTYLVEADYTRYRGKALRENVECPSLSPDGTRIAFKKKVGDGVWRLSVLDLKTLKETELAETRSVDDQALWQGDRVLYGLDNAVWAVPSDGSGRPERLAADAVSPAVTG